MNCIKAIAHSRFCMSSNVPALPQNGRSHEVWQLFRESRDPLRRTNVQAQRAAPIFKNGLDAQRDILARHGLGADGHGGRGKRRGSQVARRLQLEPNVVRGATLESIGERLALEQLNELRQMQDERKSDLRSRLTSGI